LKEREEQKVRKVDLNLEIVNERKKGWRSKCWLVRRGKEDVVEEMKRFEVTV